MLARVLQQNQDQKIKERGDNETHRSVKEIRCVLTENEMEIVYNRNEEARKRDDYWKETGKNNAVSNANKLNGKVCSKHERNLRWMNSQEKTIENREYQLGEMYEEKVVRFERESKKTLYQDQEEKEKYDELVLYSNETEAKNNGNLCKDWEIAELPSGKYYLDFKSPYFTMNERIKIIEAALEDIRERYIDAKDEYNRFNRKCSKMKRKRRVTGSK